MENEQTKLDQVSLASELTENATKIQNYTKFCNDFAITYYQSKYGNSEPIKFSNYQSFNTKYNSLKLLLDDLLLELSESVEHPLTNNNEL